MSGPRLPPHHHLSSRRLRRGCVSPCWPLPAYRSRLPPRVRSGLPLLGAPPCAVTRTPCGLDAAARTSSHATRSPVDHACATRSPIDHACATRGPDDHARASGGPPTPPAPCAAPSTPTARFADPALVYHRRGHATTLAPPDSGPSTRATRIADPAVASANQETTRPEARSGMGREKHSAVHSLACRA